MTKTKTLKTKTKTLTVATARKAAAMYEELQDLSFDAAAVVKLVMTRSRNPESNEMKAQFRKTLGLPKDFRLTDKRINDISDDLMSVHDSFTAYGQRISVALLADTLYTLKWPTAYAMPLKKSLSRDYR